jgi:hypothetical protein
MAANHILVFIDVEGCHMQFAGPIAAEMDRYGGKRTESGELHMLLEYGDNVSLLWEEPREA